MGEVMYNNIKLTFKNLIFYFGDHKAFFVTVN